MPKQDCHDRHQNQDKRYCYLCKRAPKGHFVVYVGKERKRFVIPISYLKNSNFQQLLEKAAEEFGVDYNNAIVLPCDESTFHKVITASLVSCN